jgi:hypothetical protein
VEPDGGTVAGLLLLMRTSNFSMSVNGFGFSGNPAPTRASLRHLLDASGFTQAELLLWYAVRFLIQVPRAGARASQATYNAAGLTLLRRQRRRCR